MARSLLPTPIDQPELFFALVGPVGTDLAAIASALKAELAIVGYDLEQIRVSSLMHALPKYESLANLSVPEDERITTYMNAGDQIRRDLQNGSALAALAVAEICRRRDARAGAALEPHAFLLTSLKHPDEVELLRAIYGSALTIISVYEPEETREVRLRTQIQQGNRRLGEDATEAARDIISRDQEDRNKDRLGQSVRKTFPLADFFLDASANLRGEVERLIHLLFQHPGMVASTGTVIGRMGETSRNTSTKMRSWRGRSYSRYSRS
jgi:hypothetical protein